MSRIPTITYITAAEVKEDSTVVDSGFDTVNLTKLIKIAEGQIDAYVGRQEHNPDDDNVDRIFPRIDDYDDDGVPEIPLAVYEACLRQVEYLFVNWWDESSNSLLPSSQDLKAYSVGGDGSYSEQRAKGGSDHSSGQLSDAAKAKLEGYRSGSGSLVLPDVDPDCIPESSRQC